MPAARLIALATCAKHPRLYAEEQELTAQFAALGMTATPAIWNDPAVDWTSYDAVVLRSTWDYVTQYDEFRAWLAKLDSLGVRLVNPSALVHWNLDKIYLAELARAGVPLIPTVFIGPGQRPDLATLLAQERWSRAILKPSVSAGSYQTHRFDASDSIAVAAAQESLGAITARSAALLQPYLSQIETQGELSFLFFGGTLAFAVAKRPAPGDFRVQFSYGGTFSRVEPLPAHLATARAVLAALPSPSTYARVDGVVIEGAFHLMEVELVEPYLYLAAAPEMGPRFAAAVLKDLTF